MTASFFALGMTATALAHVHQWYLQTPSEVVWPGGSWTVGIGYAAEHVTTHGDTGPHPWDLAPGDYCDTYGFQPGPSTEPAFTVTDGNDLSGATGFAAPAPLSDFQLSDGASASSSACQTSSLTWGELVNSGDPGTVCGTWCGINHAVSFGGAGYVRPWDTLRFGANPELVLSTWSDTASYTYTASDTAAWAYLCALLEDTSTTQRLEYCLDEWNSWGAAPDQPPSIFFDTDVAPPQTFAGVVTNFGPRTTYATQLWGSASTGVGPSGVGSGAHYAAAITAANLTNAIDAINWRLAQANALFCPTSTSRCYSTDLSDYQLIGLANGRELRVGSGARATLGGYDSGLAAATWYGSPRTHAYRIASVPRRRRGATRRRRRAW